VNQLHTNVPKVLNEKEMEKQMLNDPKFWKLMEEIRVLYFIEVEKMYRR